MANRARSDRPNRADGGEHVTQLVERFYTAFTGQDLDAFVATLHPAVELETARGPRQGRDAARRWARKEPGGGLDQRIVLEEVRRDHCGAHAVALIRKQWWWREAEEVAYDEPEAALFTFRDGLIARWRPFEDRDEALALLDAHRSR
jgi:ketosteroid isomerase-like protein